MPQRTDDMQEIVNGVERKRASNVTVQDLIRHALARGVKLSEFIASSGAQLR